MSRKSVLAFAATSLDTSDDTAMGGDDFLANGGFNLPVADTSSSNGRFLEGQEISGWVMARAAGGGRRVMQLWSAKLGQPLAGPFPNGSWLGLTGTISQKFPTEVGANYRLSYLSRAAGWDPQSPASSWAGGNICDVLVDGLVVQTTVTVAEPLHTPCDLYFTATAIETSLSFGILGRNAVGLERISLLKLD